MKDEISKIGPKQVASTLEGSHAYLEEDLNALRFVFETMSEEGYQREGSFDERSAIFFGHRAYIYISALGVIQRDITRNLEEMDSSVQSLYEIIIDSPSGGTGHE